MSKNLEEMNLEELWKLFPIFLTGHNKSWGQWYKEEQKALERILPPDQVKRISHVGSTAVDTIWAKPIIDILVEVSADSNMDDIEKVLCCNGWLCMSQSKSRRSFNKGYTAQGFAEKVFHLHLRYTGDNSELYFRDYLIENPDIAKEYEELKLELWKQYEYNRDGYTDSKTDFIKRYTTLAKERYTGKYEENNSR